MPLTEFGKAARRLRMEYDISLKDMASSMQIGSSYLSALEYGERTLSDDHIQRAVQFFTRIAKPEEIGALRRAAANSTDTINTAGVDQTQRHLVAAFARRLQEGKQLPDPLLSWVNSSH